MSGKLNEVEMEDLSGFEATHFLLLEAQQEGPRKLLATMRPGLRAGEHDTLSNCRPAVVGGWATERVLRRNDPAPSTAQRSSSTLNLIIFLEEEGNEQQGEVLGLGSGGFPTCTCCCHSFLTKSSS